MFSTLRIKNKTVLLQIVCTNLVKIVPIYNIFKFRVENNKNVNKRYQKMLNLIKINDKKVRIQHYRCYIVVMQ